MASVLIGLLLAAWTEIGAVRNQRERHRLRDDLARVDASAMDATREGKPVFLRGVTTTLAPLEDPEFQVRFTAVHLRRHVERLQWVETLRADGTPDYQREWVDSRVDSSDFQDPGAHANPDTPIPHGPWRDTAVEVTVGSYRLSPELIRQLRAYEPALPSSVTPPPGWEIVDQTLVRSPTPEHPQVGDLRVRFDIVPAGPVTLLARQEGVRLVPSRNLPEGFQSIRPGHRELEEMLPPPAPPPLLRETALRIGAFLLLATGTALLLNAFRVIPPPAGSAPAPAMSVLSLAAAAHLLLAAGIWLPRAPIPSMVVLMALTAIFARFGWRLWIQRRRVDPEE